MLLRQLVWLFVAEVAVAVRVTAVPPATVFAVVVAALLLLEQL